MNVKDLEKEIMDILATPSVQTKLQKDVEAMFFQYWLYNQDEDN